MYKYFIIILILSAGYAAGAKYPMLAQRVGLI